MVIFGFEAQRLVTTRDRRHQRRKVHKRLLCGEEEHKLWTITNRLEDYLHSHDLFPRPPLSPVCDCMADRTKSSLTVGELKLALQLHPNVRIMVANGSRRLWLEKKTWFKFSPDGLDVMMASHYLIVTCTSHKALDALVTLVQLTI